MKRAESTLPHLKCDWVKPQIVNGENSDIGLDFSLLARPETEIPVSFFVRPVGIWESPYPGDMQFCTSTGPSPASRVMEDFDHIDPIETPIRLLSDAATCRHIDASRLAVSVFSLAAVELKLRSKAKTREYKFHRRIEHLPGLTRCTVISEHETPAGKEREFQRRAKQVMPRPPKAAKTMSKKFADLVGVG